MSISVIIPTLNEEKFIGNLLEDLSKQTVLANEVLVVDAMSKDKTKDVVLSYPFVTFISSKPPVGNQRQVGGQKASSDLLVFLDADTRLLPDTLEKISYFFKKNPIDASCPRYIPWPQSLIHSLIFGFFNAMFLLLQYVRPSGAGACIIVTKKFFTRVGGFNKAYVFDDMEFLSRIGTRGKFAICPVDVSVSTRRIKKMGILAFMMLYLKLSWYFATNQIEKTNRVTYPFGIFGGKS